MSVSGRNIGALLVRFFLGIAALIGVGFLIDALAGNSGEHAQFVAWFLAVVGVIIAAVVCFLVFIWPTLWRYEKVGSTIARIRRFDGTTEVLTAHGWQRLTDSVGLDLGR